MDWATRKVLSWRLSNTLDMEFCIEAVEHALAGFGRPEIFNTDQASQFTSPQFTAMLLAATVRISMCGRYASFVPAEALARIFGTTNPLPNLEPTWNMAPRLDAPVVRLSREGERRLDALKWGLVPYFTKDPKKARKPINARSETIAKSGMFREAFAKRRCLVPAPVYYKWRDDPRNSAAAVTCGHTAHMAD